MFIRLAICALDTECTLIVNYENDRLSLHVKLHTKVQYGSVQSCISANTVIDKQSSGKKHPLLQGIAHLHRTTVVTLS